MKKQQNDFHFTRKEEDKARRVAHRYGLRVCKSRDRYHHANSRGGLQLVDPYSNTVFAGVNFDCTLEEVIYFAKQQG